jgi:hypothetical protein
LGGKPSIDKRAANVEIEKLRSSVGTLGQAESRWQQHQPTSHKTSDRRPCKLEWKRLSGRLARSDDRYLTKRRSTSELLATKGLLQGGDGNAAAVRTSVVRQWEIGLPAPPIACNVPQRGGWARPSDRGSRGEDRVMPTAILAEFAIERRAVGADIWGVPAANRNLMRQEMLTKTTAKENEILYWSRPCTLPAPLPVE